MILQQTCNGTNSDCVYDCFCYSKGCCTTLSLLQKDLASGMLMLVLTAAVFSYLAEQYLKNEGKPAGVPGLPATATANLTTANSLPKAALPEMTTPVPPVHGSQIPKPQVVNLKKAKTSTSQRFLKCSVA